MRRGCQDLLQRGHEPVRGDLVLQAQAARQSTMIGYGGMHKGGEPKTSSQKIT